MSDVKKTSRLILLLLLLFFWFVCSACRNPITVKRSPFSQPNTKWVSDDGTISFYVDGNKHATGEMIINDEYVEFYIVGDMGAGIHIYDIDVIDDEIVYQQNRYEYWLCSFKSKNKFVAEVKKTTYFEVDQKITFEKVQ